MVTNHEAAKRILIVEDEFLIALNIKRILEELGYEKIALAPTVARALDFIQVAPPDLAVLDMNLGAEYSVQVGDELRRRQIPYIICTAYEANVDLLFPADQTVTRIGKPIRRDELRHAVNKELAAH